MLTVSVVFAPAEVAAARLRADVPAVATSSRWADQEGLFSFDDCFRGSPPPGCRHKRRVLAFSPKPDDFLLISANLRDGWHTLAHRLTMQLETTALMLRFCVDDVRYPARSFAFIDKGAWTRHVSILYDNHWEFFEKGAMLPEEDVSTYGNRRIRSRLSNRQLIDLAVRFGVPFDGPEKVSAPGVLILQELIGGGKGEAE